MKQDVLTVVVTGVGAPGTAGTIHCLRNNFSNRPVHIIGTDVNPVVAGRYLVDEFVQVPHGSDPDYDEETAELRHGTGDACIIQTTAEACAVSEVRKNAANKKWLNDILLGQIRMPERIPLSTAYDADDAVVFRPHIGHGGRGAFIVVPDSAFHGFASAGGYGGPLTVVPKSQAQIYHRYNDGIFGAYIVTEYISGIEYSVDCFRGAKTEVYVPRCSIEKRSGITFRAHVRPHETEMVSMARRAAQILELYGAFGFQFIVSDMDHKPYLIECNPRVQGTMVASYFAGANIPWMCVMEQIDCPPTDSDWSLHPAKFLRYWGGIGVTEKAEHI